MTTATSASPNASQDAFLRIHATKVTQLLDLAGELGLVAAKVTHHPELKGLPLEEFEVAAHGLERAIRELQDLASSLRLVPLASVFRRMQRLVRDLASQTGKLVDLHLKGEETELDKVLVDQLNDPLMHIIRNSIDHGLEPADERQAQGKPEKGQITLSATQQGQEIQITIADDGRGLNREKILARARERGLVGLDETPDEATIWSFIFHSGLSTAQQVSSLSGRGVGMDVVKTAIEALRGRVSIKSQAGLGTQITLHIPLTLAFLDGLIVRVQNQRFAIPIDVVQEVIKPETGQVTKASVNGMELLRLREELVTVCRLESFYQIVSQPKSLTEQVMVVVQTSTGTLGLPVDEIIDQQQVTMKSLEGHLGQIRANAGCVLLGSGEVAIALDCEQLGQAVRLERQAGGGG